MMVKFIPFLFIFFLITLKAKASDTLTVRQAYNFSVGDTFDYADAMSNADMGISSTTYYRKVLIQKTFSVDSGSIYLKFLKEPAQVLEFDTITNLDRVAIFMDTSLSLYNGCYKQFTFNDATFAGYNSNNLDNNCGEAGSQFRLTMNLGETLNSTSQIAENSNGCICNSETLIYYSNAITTLGTPYYVANGSTRIHYIPLPEECAVWTQTFSGIYDPPFGPNVTITEQFKTGNKIYQNGIVYVPLIASIENGATNTFTSDSLIGYFYNDTLARLVYYTQGINPPNPSILYNFNVLAGQSCSGEEGTYALDSVLIAGSYRTVWQCTEGYWGNGAGCAPDIIAGIGSVGGWPGPSGLWGGTHPACGALTCFSVCGQTLYPNDNTASCPVLTDVKNINSISNITISPNPIIGNGVLRLDGNAEILSASVLDVTGREVSQLFSNQQISSFNFSTKDLSSGVYLVRVTDLQGRHDIVKLVKQ